MFLDEYIYIHIIEKFGRAQVEGSVDSRFSKGSFVDHRYRKINKWGLTGWGQGGVIQITKPDSADNSIIKRFFAGIYANDFFFFLKPDSADNSIIKQFFEGIYADIFFLFCR